MSALLTGNGKVSINFTVYSQVSSNALHENEQKHGNDNEIMTLPLGTSQIVCNFA